MEYYSAIKKNTFESVLMRWMKLEPIIQSEVSQKQKHEISGEITLERMKLWSQSKNNTQLWMGLVIEASCNAVKSNIT